MIADVETLDSMKFSNAHGNTVKYVKYKLEHREDAFDVYVFRAQVQPYGKTGLCLRLPPELSRSMDEDRRQYLTVVQMMTSGEECAGADYLFQKFLRAGGGYDFIPIPAALVNNMDLRIWTVAISMLDKSMLLQYDGYIFPDVVLCYDPLGVCDALNL